MTKVFITGINSFTGKYLENLLKEKGYDVFGLVKEHLSNSNYFYGDLLDKYSLLQALKECNPEIVIHLAALTFVGLENTSAFYQVNVLGTENLLQALYEAKCKLKKVVITSSANVYGSAGEGLISEKLCPMPINHYANSKLAMEHMTRTWFDKFPIIITRPFNYSGVGQDTRFLIPKIIDHYSIGKKKIELGNIDIKRDFSDVRDVVNAISCCIESEIHSEIFNICSGKAISIKEIISYISHIANYEIEVLINSSFVRKNEIALLVGNFTKLTELTTYKNKFSIENTLSDMYFASLQNSK